jgi:D-glycero-alpha-D-manno-heptose-7-phosphate kinase
VASSVRVPSSVKVRAPVRVLDAGGWTDTWFAAHGSVCHLAVGPGAEVVASRRPVAKDEARMVRLHLPSFGDHYRFLLDQVPGRHPMLEAALRRWAPPHCELDVTVSSPVPPGSGLGTSASVVVALISALQELGGRTPRPDQVAQCAHEVETVDLALQSGVQDQVAAAFGGANFVTIAPYPSFEVHSLEVKPGTWADLCRRVLTMYLGERHDSSAIHTSVIERLTGAGSRTGATDGHTNDERARAKRALPDGTGPSAAPEGHPATSTEKLMAPLRAAADDAATALINGDLDSYGEAMIANTEAQVALHPDLVSPLARRVIEVARRHGSVGWKVNGAGGYGGTVTVLGPDDPDELKRALATLESLTLLPLQPSPEGVRIIDEN